MEKLNVFLQLLSCALAAWLFALALTACRRRIPHDLPVINGPTWFEPKFFRKLFFLLLPLDTIPKARRTHRAKPYRLLSYTGEVIVLPSEYAELIAYDRRFSLGKFLQNEFYTGMSGLTPLASLHDENLLVQKVVRRLTKQLAKDDFRMALFSQTTLNADRLLGHYEEWRDICVYDFILDIIARIDVHAIWGDTLSNNTKWLDLAKSYLPAAVAMAIQLSIAPKSLKFLVPILSPHSWKACRCVKQAERIILPIVQQRRETKRKTLAQKPPPVAYNDGIEWAEMESATNEFDVVGTQLSLLIAAVHTSADLCTEAMILLAERQDTVDELRAEITAAFGAESGRLTKNALHRMALLDSVLKETLRIKPAVSMQRTCTSSTPITLPHSNVTIPRDSNIVIDWSNRLDSSLYTSPEEFLPDRFLRLRREESSNWATKGLFVTSSTEHLAFGHGLNVCPGRFFVDAKVKILLCHLLMEWDWELVPGTDTKPSAFGPLLVANMQTRLRFRRRNRSEGERLEWVGV